MPRKHRSSKTVISAGNLKEKANSSSHTAPLASTSNPTSAPATAKSSEQDVEMNVQHSISSDRPGNDGTDHTSALSTSDHGANDESQDEQDSPSNSEADDPDLTEEPGGAHDDFGDEMDPEHASLHDEDDDDDMDESEMAALRASEALFGFDRASTTARGIGGGSGGALAGLDAMGISGLRGLGGIMAGFTHRLKNILQSLKARGSGSSTSRLAALQELAEILAVSTEDTLAGYFQTDSFARELVGILRGESGHNESEDEEDEVALVAALTATGSSSGSYHHPSSGTEVEQMLLASRCLANLMEALPGSAHTVVHHGAVPVLCAKLLEINFIDLAEQSLSTLEKISEELPSSIVREGGLTALLQYLDFFSTNVQRTAVTAAANCCSSISSDSFEMVRDVFPILRNILSYSDQRVSEQAVLAITRVTDSYRHHPDKLQQLLTPDVLSSLTALLSPVGGTKISDNIFSAILKSFTNIGRSSPEVATNLLDAGLADTVYGILVGQTPPEIPDEHDLALELTSNSSVITQALMRKDRNQIQQAIDLVVEVLPPLPKSGIFDPKLAKKSINPQENVAMKDEEAYSTSVPEPSALPNEAINSFPGVRSAMDEDVKPDISARTLAALAYSSSSQVKESNKEAAIAHRIELLQSTSREQVVRRFNALLLPTLLEVYGASVSFTIRLKALVAVLKIAYFSKAEYLTRTLRPIPLASFLASILANRDQNSLVMYALQMVDLLLAKLPDDYHFIFRREGVMHEVNRLAESAPSGSHSSIKTRISSATAGGSRSESHISTTSNPLDEDLLQVPSSLGRHGSSSIHPFSTASTSSSSTSTKDQLIYRARHLKAKCVMAETTASTKAQDILDNIRDVVDALGTVQTPEEAKSALLKLAALFSRENDPVTSFELLESGLVEGLLRFATESRSFGPSLSVRSEILSETFFSPSEGTPAFVPLVKRLQESLGRLEGFEVLTAVASTPDDSRRSTASMLARQLKIRLVAAEGTDVPKNCANVVVSIHAIATFQAFNDYLRPRIIKAQDDERLGRPSGSSSSRLSGMLAAFAAVAGLPASSSSSPSSHLEESGFTLPSRAEAAESSQSSSLPAVAPEVPLSTHAPRRSSRLSGRGLTAEDLNREAADAPMSKPSSSAILSTSAPTDSMEVDTPRRDGMEVDDEQPTEGSPIDQEMSSRPSNVDEPPVNVQPAQDGSKMEAHTPHGTRIATPLGSRPASALRKHSNSSLAGLVASGAASRSSKPSYAAAVKAEPKDWHLAFSLGGQPIPLDTTVYGAVYAHETQPGLQSRNMWTNVYTVTFRKVDGPVPASNEDASSVDPESREEGLLPASILEGSQQASILRLLRALHGLNLDWHELKNSAEQAASSLAFAESVFINNKLTAKLNRQLEEPMIVASACLPDWACELPQQFPFLFPFETRFSFLQSTSFGYARLIQKWVGQARSDSSRRDENLGLLGRLQRQKVRISRQKILESLIKVFELYSSCRAMLEVEYFDEVGTGLGPTLEFFSLASKAFAERQYQMWRDHESDSQALHVFSRTGLFPSPMDDRTAESEKGIERLRKFKVLGQFMAKALMDSRIVDISLSRSFARLVLDYPLPLTIASVGLVDKSLAASLEHLNKYVIAKHAIEADSSLSESETHAAIQQIRIDDATVDDLALEFILPGYDVEMKPDSSETLVTIDNIEEFIELVIYWTLSKGVTRQIEMFKAGFSMVFPIRDLKSFTPDEIVNIFGNAESEDWSPEALTSAMRADHGYNMDSAAIRGLINIMSTYDVPSRRQFLQFITGAPKLPIGGFRGLHPALTVVRKAAEPGHSPDEYLPSVMTCVNYLKLPEYSSQDVAAEKLTIAIKEGADSFHLS
ncbi:Ubiquitin fusion degradation protein 4, variant 2 [Puccinia graminis f. sp. tritici]|nr:Ubiquitin fusion degradation protein 4, variant 2 [Puccinia graminis f. sp. tritici]